MWRSIIVVLSLVCLALLGWYAVRKYPGRVEAGIQLRAQKVVEAKVPGVVVKASQRDLVLAGAVATEAERKAAESLVAELSGVKTVTNQIDVGAVPPTEPELQRATLALDVTWQGGTLTIGGELPEALARGLEQKLAIAFDPETVKVTRSFTLSPGVPNPAGAAAIGAAIDALTMSIEGTAQVREAALLVAVAVVDPALELQVKQLVDRAGGSARVKVRTAGLEPGPDAEADAGGAGDTTVADTVAVAPETAPDTIPEGTPDTTPSDTALALDTTATDTGPALPEVSPEAAVAPGGALTAAQCEAAVQTAIEGEKRIKFRSNTGRLTDEGEAKLAEVAAILARCPTAKGTIEGYHDDYGDPDKLKQLTQIRAYNVHKRLGELGIDPARFRYVGLGYRNMRYGAKPGMRVLNQRIEFNITVE